MSDDSRFLVIHGDTHRITQNKNNTNIIKNFFIASKEYLLSE